MCCTLFFNYYASFFKSKKDNQIPSRAFIYSVAKKETYNSWDCIADGLFIPSTISSINKYVIPNETSYPFPYISTLTNGDAGILCDPISADKLISPNTKK